MLISETELFRCPKYDALRCPGIARARRASALTAFKFMPNHDGPNTALPLGMRLIDSQKALFEEKKAVSNAKLRLKPPGLQDG